ncbi:MAG: hypothetical protein QGH42_02600 [Kiritimatiellia bacterium]|jgi:hypothetical protein|nr:hypothetical protein [Kiritimatiellia bacterium]MDP6629743.1 hypothetical protein [Kiritimatiellia bacterium]MDP6811019.1 hypothetical protein [Kiritimatiellia bacterium]MDP7023126.1 hypothetical protein [Kiritimatiellia bacterium]
MIHPEFDRRRLRVLPLSDRRNKLEIVRDHISPTAEGGPLSSEAIAVVAESAERIRDARENDRSVILTFGAHTIKNGLGPVLIHLMEAGWVTHLATNGAGIIHDWEFAFQGQTSEDVAAGVEAGQFGIWEETGRTINLALRVGAWERRGYGESIGALIQNDGLTIPSIEELCNASAAVLDDPARAAAAADLLGAVRDFDLAPGRMAVPHPFKQYSPQAAAFQMGIPFTGHPMFGHDIIYNHPMNHGPAIGRTAERDYLRFADSVTRIDGGVYLSVGSAVMSPMIFEKALSMAQNVERQSGGHIKNHFISVVDLAETTWDWEADGEPPMDNAAYYLRYCKTFNRMGGTMRYASADNRDFLLSLCRALEE